MAQPVSQKQGMPSQPPAGGPSNMAEIDGETAPPPSYSQATGQPKPVRQLSFPGDEPSHPSHHAFTPATPSASHPAGPPWGGAYHASYQASPSGRHGHQDPEAWIPPPSEEVGKARGRRRFCVALLWAVAIYMLIGMLIGGGIEDGQRERHDRDRDRDHRLPNPNRPVFTRTWKHLPTATATRREPSEKTPWE